MGTNSAVRGCVIQIRKWRQADKAEENHYCPICPIYSLFVPPKIGDCTFGLNLCPSDWTQKSLTFKNGNSEFWNSRNSMDPCLKTRGVDRGWAKASERGVQSTHSSTRSSSSSCDYSRLFPPLWKKSRPAYPCQAELAQLSRPIIWADMHRQPGRPGKKFLGPKRAEFVCCGRRRWRAEAARRRRRSVRALEGKPARGSKKKLATNPGWESTVRQK